VDIRNPSNTSDVVGRVRLATATDVDSALNAAAAGAQAWAQTPPKERAASLLSAAKRLEDDMPRLMGLLMREAGKTASNAIAEVREAVDFLRYYAAHVQDHFANDTHRPLGPMVCISPWNFPLAIFIGQVAAALAAGNVVLAKPAEQTPLIAAEGVKALWAAGCGATAAWRRRPGGWPSGERQPCARCAVHGLHRGGAHPATGRGRARRRHGASDPPDCRDRRPERDDCGLVSAGRAGGVRRVGVRL
jgi:RHH-type proline utilization regulon transcriptional repressor/proline dehydrogenase/delta 1-pyrroline-5-carboxylate dehydrogenase